MELELRRQFFAEELQAICNFRSPGLVDAFAAVPREQFLAPGPWTVLGDAGDAMGMMGGAPKYRTTPDANRGSCSTASPQRWLSIWTCWISRRENECSTLAVDSGTTRR
jgi:hypothetical protein